MGNITLTISEDELKEVANAYRVLQDFLAHIVSPNELYTEVFLEGLEEAQAQVRDKSFSEVTDLAGFIQ